METKLAIAAALDMIVVAAVKAGRRSRQQAPKPSPIADTSGQLFPCYCWTQRPSMLHNSKECVRKDVGPKDDATKKQKLNGRVEPWTSFKGRSLTRI